jgi:hypothetical protein
VSAARAVSAAGKNNGDPHTLAFGAKVRVGDEASAARETKKKLPPRTHIWGEGEGGCRGRVLAGRKIEKCVHALAFGARVRVGNRGVRGAPCARHTH